MNSLFLTEIKKWNLRNLNWFSAVRALKRFVTDRDNKMMRDLSEVFEMSTENLNTETFTEITDRVFVKSIRALKVFVTEISDSAESSEKSKEKKAWMLS